MKNVYIYTLYQLPKSILETKIISAFNFLFNIRIKSSFKTSNYYDEIDTKKRQCLNIVFS